MKLKNLMNKNFATNFVLSLTLAALIPVSCVHASNTATVTTATVLTSNVEDTLEAVEEFKLAKAEEEKKAAEEAAKKAEKEAAQAAASTQASSTTGSYTSYTYADNGGQLTPQKGVVYYNGHRETYYSQQVLPGGGLNIPGRHVAADGTVRDADGYICVASSDLSKGTVVQTSLGAGKVYDTGCASGTIDIYTNW